MMTESQSTGAVSMSKKLRKEKKNEELVLLIEERRLSYVINVHMIA
jgi:hypothetical protein